MLLRMVFLMHSSVSLRLERADVSGKCHHVVVSKPLHHAVHQYPLRAGSAAVLEKVKLTAKVAGVPAGNRRCQPGPLERRGRGRSCRERFRRRNRTIGLLRMTAGAPRRCYTSSIGVKQKRPILPWSWAFANLVAEREGFEPPIRLPVCRISSAVLSTTQPPLQAFET
jgi:hypothetical protein